VVTDRGQAHTLEASVAALLLLVSIGIALQMTAVTPLSASTSSQHLENQLEETATGVLASSAESGELKSAILYWNSSASTFHGATTEYYYTESLPQTLSLGQTLTRTLDERNVAYNVYVVFETSRNEQRRRRMIYRGEPSEHAVTASHAVTLLSTDHLRDADGSPNGTTIGETSAFYVPNSTGTPGVYNHVRVEVVAWRI
jgi:hypothetical protein